MSAETYLGLTEADFEATPDRRYAGSQEDRLESDHEQIQLLHLLRPSKSTDLTTVVYRTEFFRNWRKLQSVNGVGLASVLDEPGTYAIELAHLRGALDSGGGALRVRHEQLADDATTRSLFGEFHEARTAYRGRWPT